MRKKNETHAAMTRCLFNLILELPNRYTKTQNRKQKHVLVQTLLLLLLLMLTTDGFFGAVTSRSMTFYQKTCGKHI